MELEGEDGSKFRLQSGEKALFGRGCGFNTDDQTVSRRHVSFELNESEPPRVSFQVIGTNPIWVLNNTHNTLKLFNKFDKGLLELGDRFCLSGKTPIWFKAQLSQPQFHFNQLDISQIDPVKEFGFLVMRHEFDQYPKGMIRNVEDWNWFLDEPSKESEDEGEDDFEGMRKTKGKRKVFKDNEDDDEWTGDSEDDKDLLAKTGKGKKPLYSTRSKDKGGAKRNKTSTVNKTVEEDDEEDDDDNDDEDDETLGGFIVTDEEDDEDQDNDSDEDEEEEEEEFEEEEEEDDD